jgi:hypothetical protein
MLTHMRGRGRRQIPFGAYPAITKALCAGRTPTPPLFPMTKQGLENVTLGRTAATAGAR